MAARRSGGYIPEFARLKVYYLLATGAMAFTAWSYAEMSRVVPHAGSVFAYATEGLGRRAGFIAGWLAMLDYLLIPSVAYLFSGIALHALVPGVPAWMFTFAAFASFAEETTGDTRQVGRAIAARRAAHFIMPVPGALVTVWIIVETGRLAKIVALAWLAAGLLITSRERERPGAANAL